MTEEELSPLVHSFKLDTELSKQQLLSLPKFIKENMAFGQIPGIRMGGTVAMVGHEGHYMEFVAGPERERYEARVRVFLDRPIRVEVRSGAGRDEGFEKQLANVLLMVVQFFEEEVRKSTLYMAFMPGIPKTAKLGKRPTVSRVIFSGNMVNLFLLSILIGIFFFSVAGEYAPILLMTTMIVLVLSAGRIAAARSTWRITEESKEVVLVQYTVPKGDLEKFSGEKRPLMAQAKLKAYEVFSDNPGLVSADRMARLFTESGMPAEEKDFLVRRIDVYSIVERAAAKFGMPVPAIVVTQDPKPNAAAMGFSKSLATMLITMGLLVQLDEEEIELVVGHELSHLRFGDPIVLFSLVGAEYLTRVYVLWPYIGIFWLPYLLFVFWSIFFFGKFLESRADLEAGITLGKPKVMADSLKKIGFRRLVLEERFLEPGVSRLGEWMRFDPHPPLYFRIERLESLDLSNPPRHPFWNSVGAVARGVLSSGSAR